MRILGLSSPLCPCTPSCCPHPSPVPLQVSRSLSRASPAPGDAPVHLRLLLRPPRLLQDEEEEAGGGRGAGDGRVRASLGIREFLLPSRLRISHSRTTRTRAMLERINPADAGGNELPIQRFPGAFPRIFPPLERQPSREAEAEGAELLPGFLWEGMQECVSCTSPSPSRIRLEFLQIPAPRIPGVHGKSLQLLGKAGPCCPKMNLLPPAIILL